MTSHLPIGGTTGLSHEHCAAVDEAARWLATTPPHLRGGAVVPQLRRRFGLTPEQACEAIREARLIQARVI